jgi:hypothetical protein
MTLKRTEMKRGTSRWERSAPMAQGKPMSRGTKSMSTGTGFARKVPTVRELGVGGLMLLAGTRAEQLETLPPVPRLVVAKPRKRMKQSRPKMTAIRASARDEECTLRFLGICNRRIDTTVLCHRNGAGGGMKSADTDACYGCCDCHRVLDGHAPRPAWLSRETMLELFEVAVLMTQDILIVKKLMDESQKNKSRDLLEQGAASMQYD